MSNIRRAPWDPPRRDWPRCLGYAGAAVVFSFLHYLAASLFHEPVLDLLSFRLSALVLMAATLAAAATATWFSIHYFRKH